MNRAQQNKALKDLQELVATVIDFEEDVSHVLMRGRFTSGQTHHAKGELSGPIKGSQGNDMTGHGPPTWGDPTGEEALWDERAEDIGKTINKMAESVSQWLNMARWVRDLSSVDVVARAQRTVPDCLACGDPCLTKVRGGFDDKCYSRFLRSGRPDRTKFIAQTKHAIEVAKEDSEDAPTS